MAKSITGESKPQWCFSGCKLKGCKEGRHYPVRQTPHSQSGKTFTVFSIKQQEGLEKFAVIKVTQDKNFRRIPALHDCSAVIVSPFGQGARKIFLAQSSKPLASAEVNEVRNG